MELEELKYAVLKVYQQNERKTAVEIEALLKIKSVSIISKVQRNLLLELWVAVIFLAFPVHILINYDNIYKRAFAVLLLIIAGLFIAYLNSLHRKIKRYQRSLLPLKTTILQVIFIVDRFKRLYFLWSMLLVPVLFACGFAMAFWSKNGETVLPQRNIIIYISCFVLYSITMFFFMKWYLYKWFGKYQNRLSRSLDELNIKGF